MRTGAKFMCVWVCVCVVIWMYRKVLIDHAHVVSITWWILIHSTGKIISQLMVNNYSRRQPRPYELKCIFKYKLYSQCTPRGRIGCSKSVYPRGRIIVIQWHHVNPSSAYKLPIQSINIWKPSATARQKAT